MATHSSILAWRILWTEKAWAGYSPWDGKESDMTEQLTQPLIKVTEKNQLSSFYICFFGSFTFLFLKVILCCLYNLFIFKFWYVKI